LLTTTQACSLAAPGRVRGMGVAAAEVASLGRQGEGTVVVKTTLTKTVTVPSWPWGRT
jgi:hypothetical protein